jgi:GTP-binding protein HflX
MTGETKAESKELFTTLSTTMRRVTINQEPFLISDTVGFISKLPAYMIDAFKSTLEELKHTDVIIAVIDISDSLVELKKKFASCMRTLSELEIEKERLVYALNKADLIKSEEIEQKIDILDLTENKKCISVSAKTGQNVTQLKELIMDIMKNQNSPKFDRNLLEGVKETFGN